MFYNKVLDFTSFFKKAFNIFNTPVFYILVNLSLYYAIFEIAGFSVAGGSYYWVSSLKFFSRFSRLLLLSITNGVIFLRLPLGIVLIGI